MNNLLNFKSFFKFLGRNKAYTLIDVFGLSVSLMFVLLIAVYTVQEMSTDNSIPRRIVSIWSGMRIGWPPEPPFLIR